MAPFVAVLVHDLMIALLTLYERAAADDVPIARTYAPVPVDASTRTVGVGSVEMTLLEPTHCAKC